MGGDTEGLLLSAWSCYVWTPDRVIFAFTFSPNWIALLWDITCLGHVICNWQIITFSWSASPLSRVTSQEHAHKSSATGTGKGSKRPTWCSQECGWVKKKSTNFDPPHYPQTHDEISAHAHHKKLQMISCSWSTFFLFRVLIVPSQCF